MTSRNSASSAPNGSSSRNAIGSRTMARPKATRWRSPLDNPDTERSRRCVMRRIRAASSTLRFTSSRSMPCDFNGYAIFVRTFMCGYSANNWNTNAMSRCDARLNVTSSLPSRMRPDVGSSSPAIIRSVVVLPQPEGPSRQKKSPSGTENVESRTAANAPNDLCRFSTRISAMTSLRKFRHDHEHYGAGQCREKGPCIEREPERLQQHEYAGRDNPGGRPLHAATPQPSRPVLVQARGAHLRSAPNVMPRNTCLRNSTVNTRMGSKKSVEPAATAGQSWPPSPMMIGMNGGAVCASPDVSRTANAYSFHAKIRQKIAVATIPVVAWGSTTLKNACSRV